MSKHASDNIAHTVGMDVIRDLGTQFRKTLVAYKPAQGGQEQRKHLETELFRKLSGFCEAHGFFHMGISAFSLEWANEPIYTAQSKEDAIAHVFYNDGVKEISFEEGLSAQELNTFCTLWAQALWGRELAVQDLVSRIWEAELDHIWLKSQDPFGVILESKEEMKEMLLSYQERMRTWINKQGKWESSRSEITQDYFVAEIEDHGAQLKVFQTDTLSALTLQDLRGQLNKNNFLLFLNNDYGEEEKKRFLDREMLEVSQKQAQAAQQLVRIFWKTSETASVQEKSMLLDAVWRSFDQLIQLGALGEITTLLSFMNEEQKAEESKRLFFSQMIRHFEKPRVLDQLMPYLGKPKDGDNAALLLSYVRDAEHIKLFPYYQKLITPAGIKRLSRVIGAMRPSAQAIINYLDPKNEVIVEELLELANQCQPDDARLVRDNVLAMEKSKLWLLALKHMPRMELLERKKQLLERIPIAGKDYEKFLFNVLVNEKDPNIVPYVLKKINTAALVMDEKKRWVHALAAVRDEKSTELLRKILSSSTYAVDLRITAALSLGKLKDIQSKSIMNEIRNKKLFGNKLLKEACSEALARMSKSAGGKR